MKKISGFLILISLVNISLAQSATDYYKRAVVKYKNQDFAGAITEYTRAIELNSTSAVLYSNRGVCKYNMEHYSEAIDDYEKAIVLDPTFVHAHFNKGNSHLGIYEFDQALLCYDETIKLDASYTKAYINRAKILYQKGDYNAALKDLNLVIAENGRSNDEKLFLERGNALSMLGKNEEALSDYSKAIDINPNYFKAYINRGQIYIKLKQHEKAIDDFTLSMRLDQASGEGYYYRGLARIDMVGEIKASKKNRKTVKEIKERQKILELACSDFEKAKTFGYGRAYEAIQIYCK